MAKDEFTPFSRSLNPFRGLVRNVDATIINNGFGAAMAAEGEPEAEVIQDDMSSRSLFLRVVQIHSQPRNR